MIALEGTCNTRVVLPEVERFEVATAAKIAETALIASRSDLRFMLGTELLPAVLAELASTHRIVLAGTERIGRYRTTYFDTEDYRLYYDHYRGKRPHVKVRVREHVDRGLAFVEVKRKTNHGLTNKQMLPRPPLGDDLSLPVLTDDERAFVTRHSGIDTRLLAPSVTITFQRITLIRPEARERVTFDIGIAFDRAGTKASIGGLFTAEVKQPRASVGSPTAHLLRRSEPNRVSMSKYAAALILTRAPVRTVAFKEKLRGITRNASATNPRGS